MIYNTDLNLFEDSFWQQPAEIVTDTEYLSQPTEKVESRELGEKIAAKLFKTLNKLNAKKRVGIGLTANQIGINKSVFIVHVKEPLYFINPEIIEIGKEKITYEETCLSLPRKKSRISRNMHIKIKADNLSEPKWFGVEYEGNPVEEDDILEAIVIQHEFDHTQGILITDLDEREMPVVNEIKYGRNEKIKIKRNEEIKEIKYKKLDDFKKQGWTLIIE